MFPDLILSLQQKLQEPLPGIDVQFEMAHVNRLKMRYDELDRSAYRQSAVLLLLYPNAAGEACILLIERVTYNGHHSGQIAFPGGKTEESDASAQQTALREFFEETGSSLEPVVIGELTPVHIPVSSFVVHPFVAYTMEKPAFSVSSREVAQLLELRLSDLLDPALVKETTIEPAPGMKIKTPYFDVQGKIVWGATAMMLNEFKHLAAG